MAAALHFEFLNLIAFVLGFAFLHVVMVIKVLAQRGQVVSSKQSANGESVRPSSVKA